MKLYSAAEQRARLEQFVTSLRKAIAAAEVTTNQVINLEPLRECLVQAETLLCNGFDRDSLKKLAQSFTPVIWVHKEWLPPLIRNADGSFAEPEWFVRMSDAHGRAEQLALELRAYGER